MDNDIENKQDEKIKHHKEAIKVDAKGLFYSIKAFLIDLLDYRSDTDYIATVSAIKNDVSIKGATAWILICSILVCSVGLNANSPAVVIGAMLISPLMGPILGVGLSIATNDIDTLRKSLINLITMLVLSLLTAFLFFYFFPLHEDTNELMGRVKPDIRDVLIAFFGGLALIIARTKKGTIASVIFGVAIATALMPPLCTAGYGLSQGEIDYFGGAMYLFTINTIFITLATFLVLKFLRFPMVVYANSRRRKNIARLAAVLAFIIILPAGNKFIKLLKETRYVADFNNFKAQEIENNSSLWLQRAEIDYDDKTISITFNGDVNEATRTDLDNELENYEYIKDFELFINGNSNRSSDKILELYDTAVEKLELRDQTIKDLELRIDSLKTLNSNVDNKLSDINFLNLAKDLKIQFPSLEVFGYSKLIQSSNFRTVDTTFLAKIKWNLNLSDSLKMKKSADLESWLLENKVTDEVYLVVD